MSNNNESRVLSRRRARELAQAELDKIIGSCCRFTHASQVPTGTPTSPDENFDS